MKSLNKWRNDPELISYLGAPFRYINKETDDAWFQSYQKSRSSQVRCAIVTERSQNAIGFVNLTDIDPVSLSCEFHILIGESSRRGKGIGTEATRLMLEHAFGNLNMHRVWLKVLQQNKRAIKVYENLGFKKEGVLREAAYKQGKYHNFLLMSILQREFYRKQK